MDGIVKLVAVAILLLALLGVAACGDDEPAPPAVAVPPVTANESKPDALKAQDVLDRMVNAYARCKSYVDSGVVKTVFSSGRGERAVEKPFKTAFVRPDRFRFEYSNGAYPERRYIVWRKGKDVRTWWYVEPGVEQSPSLSLALAGATGVSGSSAHTIPALLLPEEVSGRRLLDLTEVKRLNDAMLAGADCFRITGNFAGNPNRGRSSLDGRLWLPALDEHTLWIDKESFLVRQIVGQRKFSDFSTETTTSYAPVVNVTISDSKLKFDPPQQK